MSALDNARRIGRHAGWRFMLLWLLDRVLYRLGRTQIFIVCIHDVDWLRGIPAPAVPPYEIRWATRREVLAEADGSSEWLDPRMARAAADAGKQMVGYVYAGNSRAVCGSARMGKMRTGLIICQEGGERPWFWLSAFCRREGISVRRTGLPAPLELADKNSRPA